MTKFTRTERLAAAQAVEAGDSIASVARRFGMSERVVARSVHLYREQGEAGFQLKKMADPKGYFVLRIVLTWGW
jgi:transposase-like protein